MLTAVFLAVSVPSLLKGAPSSFLEVGDNVADDMCSLGWCGASCQSPCLAENCVNGVGNVYCSKDCSVITWCNECQLGYWGSSCQYQCDVPPTCDTTQRFRCRQTDGDFIQCSKCLPGFSGPDCSTPISCPPIQIQQYSVVTPPSCEVSQQSYNTVCMFSCAPGYELTGIIDRSRCGPPDSRLGCAADVKLCADGSQLHRDPRNNCIFPPCSNRTAPSIPRDYMAIRGAPLPLHGIIPIETTVGGSQQICKQMCSSNSNCTMFSYGRLQWENTCLLFTGDIPLNALQNALAEEGRMISFNKPASMFGSTLFTDSCVTTHASQRLSNLTMRACAFNCQNSQSCVGFQYGNDPSTPYYQECLTLDFVFPDPACYQGGARYATFIKNSQQISATRVQYEQPQGYEGSWSNPSPACVPKTCVERNIANSITTCMGTTNTVCVPEPSPGYICAGQFICNTSGLFVPFPSSVSVQCIKQLECESSFNECDPNAQCSRSNGPIHCICNPGYYGNGTFCQMWSLCPQGYVESKPPTTTSDRQCSPINECVFNNGGCDQLCINDVGSHHCSCRMGYQLASNNFSCNPSPCNPRSIPNGQDCTGSTGDACTPTCNVGYQSVGSFTCLASGEFVGYAECLPSWCAPYSVTYASTPCLGRVGDLCQPSCLPGYLPRGSLVCQSNLEFQGLAQCQAMNCPPAQPPCVFNGNVTETSCGASLCAGSTGMICSGAMMDFQCDNGWEAIGSMVCNITGLSNSPAFVNGSSPAVCRDINECSKNNGACDQICVNTPGSYYCDCYMGFTLQNDGMSCRPKPCANTLVHPLSSTVCHGSTYDTCVAVGKPGYTCSGVEYCQSTSVWTSNTKCWPRPCGEVQIPNSVTVCAGSLGAECYPQPQPGFACHGSLTCSANGIFTSFNNARCVASSCGNITIANAVNNCSGAAGSVCVPSPQHGYFCSGSLLCDTSGLWQGAASCELFDCGVCHRNASCTVLAGGVTCQCKSGFWGSGRSCYPVTPMCPVGTMEVLQPTPWHDRMCQPHSGCNSPCTGNTFCNGTSTSSVCVCKTGFAYRNSSRCEPISCPSWQIPGSKPCVGVFNTSCVVQGEEGYTCSGVMTCGRDGYWFGNPKCSPVSCPTVTFPGAVKECLGTYNDHCILKCDNLYRPDMDNATVVCMSDGIWIGASCIPQSRLPCDAAFGEFKNACGRKVSALSEPAGTCNTPGAVTTTKNDPAVAYLPTEGDTCKASCGDYLSQATPCLGSQTGGIAYADADAICRSHGARLCSLSEIQAGAIYSETDDACDLHPVWTMTPCGFSDSSVWTQVGNPLAADDYSLACTNKASVAMARCCADTIPYPDYNECDCQGCNGLGDCDPIRGVCTNTIGSYTCSCADPLFTIAEDGKTCVPNCPFPLSYSAVDGCVLSPTLTNLFAPLPAVCNELPAALQLGTVSQAFGGSTGPCVTIPFGESYSNNMKPHVLLSPTSSDAVGAWVSRVSTSSFDLCVPNATTNVLSINWIAFDRISVGPFGSAILSVEQRSKQCRRISFGASQTLLEGTPNMIQLGVFHEGDIFPGYVWVENVTPSTFDACIFPGEDLQDPNVKINFAAWVAPFPSTGPYGLVQSGVLNVASGACDFQPDRGILGELCVCVNFTQGSCFNYSLVSLQLTVPVCRYVALNTGAEYGMPVIVVTPGYGSGADSTGATAWVESQSLYGFVVCLQSKGSGISSVQVSWVAAFPWLDPLATSSPSTSLSPSITPSPSPSGSISVSPAPPTPSYIWPSQSPTGSPYFPPSPLPVPTETVDECFLPSLENINAKLRTIRASLVQVQQQRSSLLNAMGALPRGANTQRIQLSSQLQQVNLKRSELLQQQLEYEKMRAEADY